MVDLSSEDIDKITKMVYAKIAEAMACIGEVSTTRMVGETCTFGCPNGNKFGCPFAQFKCTGDYFTCAPQYAAVHMR